MNSRMDKGPGLEGMIFNIQLHSTEDGPGIRTSIFMKGCTMHCSWCHNPEGMKCTPELIWYDIRCIGATDCLKACPKGALALAPEGMIIDRKLCDACGDCAKACPAAALEVVGKKYTVDEVVQKALSDRVFYIKSGGGVTLSGGEPALQADFSFALMKALKCEGIHLVLDTCGGVKWDILRRLIELADMVLYDLKLMDGEKHLDHTGIPIDLILDNARKISRTGKPMWIRTPVIPGYNSNEDDIRQISRFIRDNLPTVQRYDLLAFNNTCSIKYRRLGRAWSFEGKELLKDELMEKLAKAATEEGLDCVYWSGMTKQ